MIVLSNQRGIESFVRNSWLVDLIFLRYPADDQEFQRAIALLAGLKTNGERPVLIAGSLESQTRIERLPLFGGSTEPVLLQGEPGVGKRLMAKAIHSSMPENPELVIDTSRVTDVKANALKVIEFLEKNNWKLFCNVKYQ